MQANIRALSWLLKAVYEWLNDDLTGLNSQHAELCDHIKTWGVQKWFYFVKCITIIPFVCLFTDGRHDCFSSSLCHKDTYCVLNLLQRWLTLPICFPLSLIPSLSFLHSSLIFLHLLCFSCFMYSFSCSQYLSRSLSAGWVHVHEEGKPHACSARWCLLLRYPPCEGINTHTATHLFLYICFY